MGNLFDHLDQDKRNEITLESFVKAQRTSGVLQQLLVYGVHHNTF